MSKQFAVIGLGRVGVSLVETLDALGHEVLGIEEDEDIVQDVSNRLPNVALVSADATDDGILKELGVENFDGAAVVIGENIQASVLVTMTLKDLGVPLVLARATNSLHGRVLERVGADHVVQPEKEFGQFLARRISSPGLLEYFDLGEDEAVVEVKVPRDWAGKTLADLQLSRKKGLTVLAIKPEGERGIMPRPDRPLSEDDVLVVGGNKKRIDEISGE